MNKRAPALTARERRELERDADSDHEAEHNFAVEHTPIPHHDFEGVTTEAARVGMQAIRQVEKKLSGMGDRELVSVAKMGVVAITQNEKAQTGRAKVQLLQKAVMLMAGGQFEELPAGEVIEGESIEVTRHELLAEVATARSEALAAAGYDDEGLDAAIRG